MAERIWLSNHSKDDPLWESKFRLFFGRPEATKEFTVESLENMGMVGVYRDSDDPAS